MVCRVTSAECNAVSGKIGCKATPECMKVCKDMDVDIWNDFFR